MSARRAAAASGAARARTRARRVAARRRRARPSPLGQMLDADERQRLVDPRPDLRRLDAEVLEPEGDLVRDLRHHDLVLRILEDRRHRAGEIARVASRACRDPRRRRVPENVPPWKCGTSPASARSRLDLPEPDGPSRAMCSPSADRRARRRAAPARPGGTRSARSSTRATATAPPRRRSRPRRRARPGHGRPRRARRPRSAGASVTARLHRLGEIQPALERAGEQRRELAHRPELDAAAAKGDPQVTRVALEHRDEARRERDGERRAPRPAGRGEQPVVVEQQRVDREREPDRSRAAAPGRARCAAPPS